MTALTGSFGRIDRLRMGEVFWCRSECGHTDGNYRCHMALVISAGDTHHLIEAGIA
jgi:hypothetical protein